MRTFARMISNSGLDRLAAVVRAAATGRRSPSWKTSVLSHAHRPGHAAADVAVVRDRDARSRSASPPAKDGLTTKMSGVWLAPSNGSLTM